MKVTARYDLFLAHPSADKPSARALYHLLQPDVRAFLDQRSLPPGARWDQEIPAAQRASRATVVLISSHADAAWYGFGLRRHGRLKIAVTADMATSNPLARNPVANALPSRGCTALAF